MHSARTKKREKILFILATYVYASSQGQRTHSARTKMLSDQKKGKTGPIYISISAIKLFYFFRGASRVLTTSQIYLLVLQFSFLCQLFIKSASATNFIIIWWWFRGGDWQQGQEVSCCGNICTIWPSLTTNYVFIKLSFIPLLNF
jgi:hypothetical protein